MKFIYFKNYYYFFFLMMLLLSVSNSFENQTERAFSYIPKLKSVSIGQDSIVYLKGAKEIINQMTHNPVALSFRLNSISFLFDTANWPENLHYQYFLEGFDRGWKPGNDCLLKEYINLPKGEYIFHAKFIGLSVSENNELRFSFKVLPPFYKTRIALFIYFISALLILLTISRLRSYRFARERFRLERIINDRTDALVREKDKSENLLANVLPKDTADELKLKGRVSKKKYQMVTVLFSDIQGFTKIAEQMNPEMLIDKLDDFFFHFDSVVEKYNIEKIKTIGDAYMCAGGIPIKNRTNPIEVVLAALEMQQYMKDLHVIAEEEHNQIWDIRIGIHTGAVIAGVVGHKKLSYDIWGDTVNTASRMESSGVAGMINISGSTYQLVKDFFICEYRGKMPVKYKGEIDMYFVKGIRPDLASLPAGIQNKKFEIRLKLLRINDLEEFIKNKMETELSSNMVYHNLKHTIHVYTQVELLGRAEKVSDEELLFLQTAGIMHDTGFLVRYEEHENASCDFAKEILPLFKYSETEIKQVCKLILATHPDHKPENKLEQIICDANSDYIGRFDFNTIALKIFHELKENNQVKSFEEWKKQMHIILSQHEFYTSTAQLLIDVTVEEQMKKLAILEETG